MFEHGANQNILGFGGVGHINLKSITIELISLFLENYYAFGMRMLILLSLE